MTFWTDSDMLTIEGKPRPLSFKAVGALSLASGGTAASLDVAMPAGVSSGNTLVMVLTGSSPGISDANESVPAGWTRAAFFTNNTYGALAVYTKRADGTEGAAQTVLFPGTTATEIYGGIIVAYDGGLGLGQAGSVNSGNASIPAGSAMALGLTALLPGILLRIYTIQRTTTVKTVPTGMTLLFSGSEPGGDWSLAICELDPSGAGVIGNLPLVWNATDVFMSASLQVS